MSARRKKSRQKTVLVTISTLALSAVSYMTARAQVKVTCSQKLYVGSHAACGTGSLVINPDSSTMLSGCLVSSAPPQPGRCRVFSSPLAPTASVVVTFTNTSINIVSGTDTAKVDGFVMQHSGAATPKTQFTFTPTEVSNTVTLDIGGTFHFNKGLALGTYTGNVTISAN